MSRLFLISCEAPNHGWLPVTVQSQGQTVLIDASDVPNNPVQDLIGALEAASCGREACVWWHVEPDGFVMDICRRAHDVSLRLVEQAPNGERQRGACVLEVTGTHEQVLLPLWRFVRDFQSQGYQPPHWPVIDYGRMDVIRQRIKAPE